MSAHFRLLLAFFAVLGLRNASADPLNWTDATQDDTWGNASNWHDPYNANRVPLNYDVVYINAPENFNSISVTPGTVAAGSPNTIQSTSTYDYNPLNNLVFQSGGNGYTFFDDGGGLNFTDYSGIFMQANVSGNGEGEDFEVPIQATGRFFIDNFSPTTQESGITGFAGYNNPLTFNGPISFVNGGQLLVQGIGSVDLNNDITGGNVNLITETSGAAVVTISGNNIATQYTQIGGNTVFDYTNNDTEKFSPSAAFVMGTNGDSGHATFLSNQSAETDITMGNTYLRGSNSMNFVGSSDPTVATIVNLGGLNPQSNGGVTDITTSGNVSLYTTSSNNGQYGAQINIIGQYVTLDQTYWAQSNGNTYAGQYPNYGNPGTPELITPLTHDDGDAFNSQWGNFTVDAGGQTLNAVALGANEGADTIRFTSAGTLDLGGGTLNMVYGGIMVTAGVTGDTAITDGNMLNNRDLFGLSLINYSTGTLTVSANLGDIRGPLYPDELGKDGAGTVVLSGDNRSIAVGSSFAVNQGLLVVGSQYGLGQDLNVSLGDATAAIDLQGHSVTVASLNSNNDYTPGNQAAAAGLNSNIFNSVAGTTSRITVSGYTAHDINGNPYSNSDGNVGTGFVDNDVNLGFYYGGLNEVSGSILSLDVEQGTATTQVQFDLGTSTPYGDANQANVVGVAQAGEPATLITGSIIVGAHANLGLQGYGNIETLGVTDLNGNIGAAGQQAAYYGTTYLTGTGAVVAGYGGWGFDLNPVGSVADTFAGNFGTSTDNASMSLILSGTGAVNFTNGIYNNGLTTEGTTKLVTPGLVNGGIFVGGESAVTVTGTSGNVVGSGGALDLYGGILTVAPSGSGQNVTVYGGETSLQSGGNGEMILNRGNNTSLTLILGNTNSFFGLNNTFDQSIIIGATDGIAGLGTTEKVVALSNGGGTMYADFGRQFAAGSLLSEAAYVVDMSAGGHQDATYLTYNGTGAATDVGFQAYQYDPNNIDNLNNAANNSVSEKIDTDYAMTVGKEVFTVEVDHATLTTNGALVIGWEGGTETGGLILNGGTINGPLINNRAMSIYTNLQGGSISNLIEGYGGQDVSINGPGVLTLGGISGLGQVNINDGILNLGTNVANPFGRVVLNGGVLEGTTGSSGIFNRVLGRNQFGDNNDFIWNGGGFAAKGGMLLVDLTDANGDPVNLVWGATGGFLGQGAVMQFGAANATSFVRLDNNIDLGIQQGGYTGQNAAYSRVIDVTANANDAGDPTQYADFAQIDGNISGSNPYEGLAKDGNGTLYLRGLNTYTGATTIADGALVIYADSNLGTGPTAAYGLNTTPGLSGAALTPGAILINGGATLGAASPGASGTVITLNPDRQILLASGATGATPSIINVVGDNVRGYTELDFGGLMADYVNEVGSLQKQGGGTFNYSGTAYNTGADSVTGGTFAVTGTGSVNSVSGINVDNATPTSNAKFNYASTAVGLSPTVTIGADGGTFAYNSAHAYSGATTMTIGAKQTLSGGVGGAGNLSGTAFTIGNGGTLLPGDVDVPTGEVAVGALTTGGVTLLDGGNYNFILADMLGAAGTGYSTVDASSLDLTGLLAVSPFNINVETINASGFPGEPAHLTSPPTFTGEEFNFVLFQTGAGGITALTQDQLNSDFAIYLGPNNGATGFDPLPGTWEVVENASDSQLILQYTVPEPSTWAMLAGGLVILVVIRRARQRSSV